MIRAAGLGKKFRLYPRPAGRLVEWLTLGAAKRHDDFWALKDVHFDVKKGECLGVIGVNGSGKSTLLKILSGSMYPTTGTFQTQGRVLSLLELGTGLAPDLTGRQNVLQSARLLAYDADYAHRKFPQIESFAELGDFFDRPIRLYSSGMLVRLVFSMFACFDPDIFVVDEALSVGDLHFQQKCATRIGEMKAAGVTMLFVSHDLAAIDKLCDRVMVLHAGQVRFLGDKRRGIQTYYDLVGVSLPVSTVPAATDIARPSEPVARSPICEPVWAPDPQIDELPWQSPDTADHVGDGRVAITGLCYRRPDGQFAQVVPRGEWIEIWVQYRAAVDISPLNGGMGIYDRFNQLLFAVNWINADLQPLTLRAGEQAVARFRFRADLEPGEYTLWLGASQALPDPQSHTGWNQHLGGERFAGLPRAGKIAVLARPDNRRESFGPANLQYTAMRWGPKPQNAEGNTQ